MGVGRRGGRDGVARGGWRRHGHGGFCPEGGRLAAEVPRGRGACGSRIRGSGMRGNAGRGSGARSSGMRALWARGSGVRGRQGLGFVVVHGDLLCVKLKFTL